MNKIVLIIGSIFWMNILHAQETKYFMVSPYSKLEVFGSIEVTLVKTGNDSAKVLASSDMLDKVKFETENDQLSISLTDKMFDKNKDIQIFLPYGKLKTLKTRTGGEINSNELITSDTLSLEAAGGSTINIKTDVNRLIGSTVEGSTISLNGNCKKLQVDATTGGIFEGFDFKCDTIDAKANTGGLIKIFPVTVLNASASMGGTVSYCGNPKVDKEHEILGGKIERTPGKE